MSGRRAGASQSTVDLWRRCHSEVPNTTNSHFKKWSQMPASGSGGQPAVTGGSLAPRGGPTAPRSSSTPHFEATYWELGSKQGFDASSLGDKYPRHSIAIQHPSRFNYLDKQTPLSRSMVNMRSPVSPASPEDAPRYFHSSRLKDKFGFHSTGVHEPVRWDYLDPARSWPRSAALKGRRFELAMLGDKYSQFSTPISDVARFGFMDPR
mmetsp:Transcript_22015/g.66140  ORF Transcript_22015/g.66140 Transcript_22015/m.66140 type:complete len:208 (+) Transcript_22015:43-666(+)